MWNYTTVNRRDKNVQKILRSFATTFNRTEKIVKRNGRNLTYALLFYCIITTIYWLPFLFSVRHMSQSPLEGHNFPLRIWQTEKFAVSALDIDTQGLIQTWIKWNPKHRYEMITDGSGEALVAQAFRQQPEIVRDFLALQDPVLRADFLRYLVLYAHGGIYTDVDTVCLKPFSAWIRAAFKDKANVIIGIEGDSLGGPKIEGFSHHVGFGQWTLAAKPGHFLLERVIERVQNRLRMLAEKQNSTISTLQPSYKDVIDTTGPGVFTESIYQHLSIVTGTDVSSSNLTGLTEPRLIGDVLILPVTAFASGVPHSNAKAADDESALVQHLFAGSWKHDRLAEASPIEDSPVEDSPVEDSPVEDSPVTVQDDPL